MNHHDHNTEERNNEQNAPQFTEEQTKYIEEKKSDFIKSVTESFDAFVSTFKKNGLLFVTFVLVLFMIFYSFILNPININKIIDKVLDQNRQETIELQQKSIEQRLKSDKIMLNIMNDLASDYGVDRAMLFELHNSTQNISGVEFLYMSCSYEILNTENYELEYIADSFQKQFLTQFVGIETYNKLKHVDYLYFDNLEQYHRSNYRLISKLKHFGANSVMLIPFVNKNNMPIVILVLVSEDNTMDANRIYNYVKTFRTPIEENLMMI